MGEGLIEVVDVHKRYPDGTQALQGVNLAVQAGEFISLVGASGCGKSTLLRVLAGLEPWSGGKVSVAGHSPEDRSKAEMSFVFQEPTLLPWRTVIQNVALPLELKGVGLSERNTRAKEALELVGLSERAKAYPRELSGGMKMRVSIARALVTRPQILLMDEPFGALDEITRQRLNDELLSLKQSTGATVVFVTHNMFEAVYLSQRIAIMTPHPGQVTEVLEVPVAYPRDASFRASELYGKLVYRVLSVLEGDKGVKA